MERSLTAAESSVRTSSISNEIAELQRRLDAVSDEELEKLFKGSAKFASVIPPEVDMFRVGQQLTTNSPKKRYPKARPLNPEIRAKFEELDAFEAELEKLYDNPLAVWEDIIKNPDKFIDPDDTRDDGIDSK